MKIIQCIDSLSVGGAERMCLNISLALTSRKIENYVISTRSLGPLFDIFEYKNLVFCLNKKNFIDVFAFFRFYKIVSQIKPNVIHAHSSSVFWCLLLKLFFFKFKLIWHDHDGTKVYNDNDRKFYIFISRFLSGVIVVNDHLYHWCLTNFRIRSENLILLYNFPYFSSLPSPKILYKKNEFIIVCLANILQNKNQMELILAVKLLISSGFNVKLFLIGNIYDTDYYSSLISFVTSSGLSDSVSFFTNVSNPFDLLSISDIGVICSKNEGLPVALLEYGLFGLPTVCSNVGFCSQVLNSGENGILLSDPNSEELFRALSLYLSNLYFANTKANNFRNFVLKNYSSDAFLDSYLGFLFGLD